MAGMAGDVSPGKKELHNHGMLAHILATGKSTGAYSKLPFY